MRGLDHNQAGAHIPVLLSETIELLAVKAGGRYLDGTFGRGGHALAILARGGEVLAIDRDGDALTAALGLSSTKAGGRLRVVRGLHGDLASIARAAGWERVDGVLLDLGVSSPQLDDAARGFSFRHDGPLDMRMDASSGPTAADLVNSGASERLEAIFRDFGEEPQARRIARAIVEARAAAPLRTTRELAELVERAVGRHGAHHPATRVFQALRMAVNDEAGELGRALGGALEVLAPGGRLAVITFESLTDRMVKRFFAEHAGREVALQQGGSRWEGMLPRVRVVTRRPVVAGAAEVESNPRARSAKLRVATKGI